MLYLIAELLSKLPYDFWGSKIDLIEPCLRVLSCSFQLCLLECNFKGTELAVGGPGCGMLCFFYHYLLSSFATLLLFYVVTLL